jgi:hypothetical protein
MTMRPWVLLTMLLGAFGLAQGCYYVDADADEPAAGGSSGSGTPQLAEPGARCSCDTDCAGTGAICFLGMCALRAQGWCLTHASEEGCSEGFRCINSDIVTDGGVCFPLYDAATCAVVENRDGLCSPTRADFCDASCGTACVPDTTAEGTAGAACVADSQCDFNAEAKCHSDTGTGEPNGWVEGYCLSFACTSNEECGDAGKGCYPVANDGSGVCMDSCHMDLDCRWGYRCRQTEAKMGPGMCFAGCDAAALCPGGYVCAGGICIDENTACTLNNPHGWCPDGSWCDEGVCNDKPFACDGKEDALEPNDSRTSAVDIPSGVTEGLYSCAGNEDWFRVTVPAGKIARVGIEFSHNAGDLDLVAYDGKGDLIGTRIGDSYPYSYRDQETGTEYFGFYSQQGTATYYVRALGYGAANAALAENVYSLHLDLFDYQDGEKCLDGGWTFDECAGKGPKGSGLIPFPFPDPNDAYLPEGYLWDTYGNYRFARREMVMLIRHALHETYQAFPGSNPLGLIDVCQKNGITPGYDVGSPRHPETTHDQGGNIDIAYFQTDGNNSAEIICGDGAQHADGFCSPAATEKHFVDLPRQAYFMAQLFSSNRTRVIGVDKIIGPLLTTAAQALAALDPSHPQYISPSQLAKFGAGMAYGSGWPYHHHHIHVSLQWWTSGDYQAGPTAGTAGSEEHHMMRPGVARRYTGKLPQAPFTRYNMKWPPRPR